MRHWIGLVYGGLVYVLFFITFLYIIAFLAGFPGLKNIDSGVQGGVATAVIIDLVLLGVFAVQHSVMARQAFKRRWTRIVPKPIERSTYVLAATAAAALLIWQWRPITQPVWTVGNPVGWWMLTLLFWFSWGMLLFSTFLIDHFSLFGLRQVYCDWRGQPLPPPVFKTPVLYQSVRHPIYCCFIAAFWATPIMTAGHLLFALGATGYIFIGARLEEKDLAALFGDLYRSYQQRVPMLLPRLKIPRRYAAGGEFKPVQR